jgi:ubiquinone/menaquinone biosynthesis C-methylase UbiE
VRQHPVERPGHLGGLERLDEIARVANLPPAAAAHEAPELLGVRPSLPSRLLLEGAEGPELSLGVDDPLHGGGAQGPDQLVFQVGDADVEAEPLHLGAIEVGAESRPLEPPSELALLRGVAKAPQPHVEPVWPETVQELRDRLRAADRHDRDTLGLEVPATPLRKRLESVLVARPFDEHDRVNSLLLVHRRIVTAPMGHDEHLDRLARVYSPRFQALRDELDRSLSPRGPEMLLEAAAAYLTPESLILDVGCRDARHLIELVQTHGCRGVALDPLDWHLERAHVAVEEARLADRIEIVKGVIEEIEQPDERFDLVWCRDVLELVEDLDRGLAEAARVLKRDGAMVVYTNFATELFEPREAEMIHGPLGNVPANLDEEFMEAAFARAGLLIDRKDVIGTEWRERDEEEGRPTSQNLLRLARLRRRRDEIVAEYRQEMYDVAQASLQWMTYQLLGKLKPTMYVLRRGG